MAGTRILVVEDEGIVAKDIQTRLEGLGYDVPAIAGSGEEALQKAAEVRPDLVLMDIKLKGDMDGVEASRKVRDRFHIPTIFLTAFADDSTLQRAKITEPFGYIIKPFEENELRTNIEIALYKHGMERKLRESEEWLATTLKSIGDGVIATDRNQCITFMNPVAEKLTGWKQQEASGLALSRVLNIVDEKTGAPADNPVEQALREGRTTAFGFNVVLIDAGGGRTPVADSAAPIRDDRGDIAGAVMIFRDVTEHRRAEERLREARKLESVGQLAGGVAHEFNNLLMVIRGYNELLLGRLGQKDPLRRNAEEVRDAADRATALTQQLLAFSRRQMLRPCTFDFNAVITTMEKYLDGLFGEEIEVVTVLQPDLEPVKADLGQVQQIIINLAVNARDAMPDGGTLTLQTSSVQLSEDFCRQNRGARPGPHVMLAVSDTGTGMDSETQAHIFEPFFTTKERAKSSGLGLATIHGIVLQSGGYISVESERERGTTFRIYLPQVEEADRPAPDPQAATASPLERRTVLLVEAEAGIRKLIRDFLEGGGYTVLEAADGLQALQVSARQKESIHLVLAALALPGMSGKALVDQLEPQHAGAKVLYMTDLPDRVDPSVAQAGAAFLPKPFSMDELSRKIRELLDEESPQSP